MTRSLEVGSVVVDTRSRTATYYRAVASADWERECGAFQRRCREGDREVTASRPEPFPAGHVLFALPLAPWVHAIGIPSKCAEERVRRQRSLRDVHRIGTGGWGQYAIHPDCDICGTDERSLGI